jgi:hypothetical protein
MRILRYDMPRDCYVFEQKDVSPYALEHYIDKHLGK